MTLRVDWATGELVTASDMNNIGTAVNSAFTASIVDAKGDLIAATAADTVGRLAVSGTNGHALVEDSTQATGLIWRALTKTDVGLNNVTNNAQYYPGGTDVAVADGGTGVGTLTGIVKGNGTSAFTAATAGTDYVAPGGALGTPSSGALTNCTFPTLNQSTTGSAATLTTPRTINGISFNGSAPITIPIPYDISAVVFSSASTRAAGTGDFPFGVKLQRAVTLTSVTFRANTADASGNLVVELRKNGTLVSGTSTTIAAANQVAGATSTGSWAFAVGDILTAAITAVGTTPGTGLCFDATGTA